MDLGNIIKDFRKKNNISMQEFADKCSLSKGYISMLENGVNPRNKKPIAPTLPSLKKISVGLDIDTDTLLKMLNENQKITLNSLYIENGTEAEENTLDIMLHYNKLNKLGKETATEHVRLLTLDEKYTRPDEPPIPVPSMEEMEARTRQYDPLEMPEGSMPDLIKRINSHKAKDA